MTLLVVICAALITGILLAALGLRSWELRRATRLLDHWRTEESAELGAWSRQRSNAVLRGQITEQLAPLLDGFGFDPADARFLGRPIDYVVFDGYGEVRSGERRHLREIVLIDIKTGRAALSKSERRIRRSVENGVVRSVLITPSTRAGRLHGDAP
jgi:predicted Holliday junction resolvase-like endonuclease